tara:strand:+ start:2085 stop:2684 length:600 start_codon:yes stop_codon:yes gene_type:complete
LRIDFLKSFNKIFSFVLFSLIAGFLWWTLLLFNTFPKKLYYNNSFKISDSVGIIVLTGGKNRIEKGVDLLSKGYGDKLLISGVFMPSEIESKFSLEKEKKELFKCCIFYDQKSKNTLENAQEVEKWLSENKDIESIILVTSYYHLPRSIMIFEKKIKSNVNIYPTPAVQNNNFKKQFFFHLKLIISEYFKVIYSIIFIR